MFYVRSLKWDEEPNYKQLINMFTKLIKVASKAECVHFDWISYKAKAIEDRAVTKILKDIMARSLTSSK